MNETITSSEEQAYRFVTGLDALDGPDGRRRLAELRRAAPDPIADFNILSVIRLPGALDDREFDLYRITAVLLALHKQKLPQGERLPGFSDVKVRRSSFGASIRQLRDRLTVGQDSLDQRFGALLNSHSDDIYEHLRQMVQRIAGYDPQIPIDYARLLLDMKHWDGDTRWVQRKWAREYWEGVTEHSELEA